MRKSLYLKDDDYRLSFLYGNFTTLTRFTEADLERVVTERLSPLYVSIHATDPNVRTRLLRNRRGATSLRWLELLLDAGIEVHGQVVVCPGINDGVVLEETMLGVLDRFPQLATVGVVPLGVSAHSNEAEMREHTLSEAAAVVDTIERWQTRFAGALGRRLVYAADEYYLLAGRSFPALDDYDGCPQHENGIGMSRTFEAEVRGAVAGDAVVATGPRSGFFAWVDAAPADGYRAPRLSQQLRQKSTKSVDERHNTCLITGELGALVLEPLLRDLPGNVRLLPIKNQFFGGNIGVTGLLTGADIAAALEQQPANDRYLLPDVTLSRGRFLDGMSAAQLPRTVEVVPTDGASLVHALTR
jgi:NifB/MoaA-like Fe-S oxidoreductase